VAAFSEHIFVCGNVRAPGHSRGCCDPEGADRLRNELKLLVKSRGLGTRVRVNKSGCLDQCEHGPTLVIYPQAIWYGGVTEEDLPRIVDETIIGGKILDDLVIRDECLCNPDCEHIRARANAVAETPAKKATES
jgi:(2Fe-2S) ferredoxin